MLKLLDQVRVRLLVNHRALRTQEANLLWIPYFRNA